MVYKTLAFLSRGYEESMDAELQELFNFAIKRGVTLFDTADSYGGLFCSSTQLMTVLRILIMYLLASIRWANIKMCMAEQSWASIMKYIALPMQALGA